MNTKRSLNKRISFAPRVSVRETLHLNNYSDSEMSTCWYTDREKRLINLEIRGTIMIMNIKFKKPVKSDYICTRGLEQYAPDAKFEIFQKEGLNAVLDEQQSQVNENICNPQRIADVYSTKTRKAKEIAKAVGYNDQACVIKKPNSLCANKIVTLDQQQTPQTRSIRVRRRSVLNPAA